jgi:hypothetical protein
MRGGVAIADNQPGGPDLAACWFDLGHTCPILIVQAAAAPRTSSTQGVMASCDAKVGTALLVCPLVRLLFSTAVEIFEPPSTLLGGVVACSSALKNKCGGPRVPPASRRRSI